MTCPKCGGVLHPQKFIETWDAEDNPDEIGEYLVCEKCKVAWLALDLDTLVPYIEKRQPT